MWNAPEQIREQYAAEVDADEPEATRIERKVARAEPRSERRIEPTMGEVGYS
jgi:hypothetical protein